jgi:CBS domain-containing protein
MSIENIFLDPLFIKGKGMKIIASDIMTTRFHTLTPQTPVNDAVKFFKQANQEEGRKIFGMMVIDEEGQLVGMISMYDILLFMRPKHTHIWGMMEDIDIAGIVDTVCKKTKSVLVGDIMTPEVITITPQTHIFMILDIMIKKHIRRLPVLESGKIMGIVYISDLFFNFLDRFTD